MKLTDAELNQILASLRFWQRTVGFCVPEEEAIFFEDCLRRFDADEIDDLCEKLNEGERK